MNKILLFLIGLTIVVLYYSCGKENKSSLSYVGTWETEVYTVPIDTLGSLENQKMIFVFRTDSFSNTINLVIGPLDQPIFKVSGTIDKLSGNNLYFKIIQMGEIEGTDINWMYDGTSGFDSLYVLWIAPFMPVTFNSAYEIADNKLDLIINETDDTLHLNRI
jgi:hypothetical protein